MARSGQRDPVQGGGLVPVTVDDQDFAHRGGDGDGVQRDSAGGDVVGGGVQLGRSATSQAGTWAGATCLPPGC
jgi:hypothetical protein